MEESGLILPAGAKVIHRPESRSDAASGVFSHRVVNVPARPVVVFKSVARYMLWKTNAAEGESKNFPPLKFRGKY